jgi:hypothetical protein
VASDCLNLSIFFDTKLQVFYLCIKKGGKQVQFYTLLAYTNQGEKVERENTGNRNDTQSRANTERADYAVFKKPAGLLRFHQFFKKSVEFGKIR